MQMRLSAGSITHAVVARGSGVCASAVTPPTADAFAPLPAVAFESGAVVLAVRTSEALGSEAWPSTGGWAFDGAEVVSPATLATSPGLTSERARSGRGGS